MNEEHDIEALFAKSRLRTPPAELRARVLTACRAGERRTRIIPLFVKYALAASWVAAVALQIVASRQEPDGAPSAAAVAEAPSRAPEDWSILNGLAARLRRTSESSSSTWRQWVEKREEIHRLTKGEDAYDI